MLKFYKKITSIFILIITIYVLIDFNLKLTTGIIKRRYLIITPMKTSMSDLEEYLKKKTL